MRKLFSFCFIFFFVLTSCSIQKKLDKYCPLCPDKEVTIIETVYKDSTITIPGETISVIDSVYCDSLGNVYAIRLYEKDGQISKLQTSLNNNKYKVVSTVDTVYQEIKIPSKSITKVETIKLPPIIEKYIPWWAKFLIIVGLISIIIHLISFIFKRLKGKINLFS